MGLSLDVMEASICLNLPTDAKVSFDSNNSPSATSASETEFDPNIVGDKSQTATNGSSRVKRDAPGWRRSAMSLLRGSKTQVAKLRPDSGTSESSNSESEGAVLGRLSNSSSMVSSSDAEFEACREISEDATNESSTKERDTTLGTESAGSFLRSSKKFLAKFRADGGKESSDFGAGSEDRRARQEVASKLLDGEDPRHTREEGPTSNHLEPTVVLDGEGPIGRSQLEGQEQSDRHERRPTRATKGYVISIPKSVKQLRKSKPDEYRRKVVVNGVPIKDVDVKKAEERAGPIHPGDYWYDIQAGFWGVKPGPCLGIIPPCIMELNAPMCKSCSGGNTGILVNGRELHEKDLERLSFRGLPTTPGMAYCISIDGRVTDENSQKYVTSLGLLAPSLGKYYGRGSGIYMPAVY